MPNPMPSIVPTWDTSGTNMVQPSSGLVASGYATNGVPASASWNWQLNYIGRWLTYLEALTTSGNQWSASQFLPNTLYVGVGMIVNPTAAPVPTTLTTGGTIAAGTYLVTYTWVSATGETMASPEAAVTTTGTTSTITVPVPSFPAGTTSANVYVTAAGGASGTETLQGAISVSGGSITLSSLTTSGAVEPTSNTFNDDSSESSVQNQGWYSGYGVFLNPMASSSQPMIGFNAYPYSAHLRPFNFNFPAFSVNLDLSYDVLRIQAAEAVASDTDLFAPVDAVAIHPDGTVTVKSVNKDASGVANPSTAPAPTTQTTGGTILAGTYQCLYTWVTALGETQVSPVGAITTSGTTSTITVPLPVAFPTGVTSANVYVSQAGGTAASATLQGAIAASGGSLTLTAPPTTSGAAEPQSNTTSAALQAPSVSEGGELLANKYALFSLVDSVIPALNQVDATKLVNLATTLRLGLQSAAIMNLTEPIAVNQTFTSFHAAGGAAIVATLPSSATVGLGAMYIIFATTDATAGSQVNVATSGSDTISTPTTSGLTSFEAAGGGAAYQGAVVFAFVSATNVWTVLRVFTS